MRSAIVCEPVSDAWSVAGYVLRGDGVGRQLGFPTANLRPHPAVLPANGVYAAIAGLDGEPPARPAMAYVGTRPTFGCSVRVLEVHLFGFDGDLYGRRVEVVFRGLVRREARYGSPAALEAGIRTAAARARRVLGV